ncbi:MAG: S24 family peptidase [Rubrivivax sp.]
MNEREPERAFDDADAPACSGSESFALRVLGEDMAPEFRHGEIIVIEPGGAAKDGSYVLAQHGGEWLFRQLRREADGRWSLHATNPACTHEALVPLADLAAVRGVVIQKAVPGQRRLSRFYV